MVRSIESLHSKYRDTEESDYDLEQFAKAAYSVKFENGPSHKIADHIFEFIEIEDVGTDIATLPESKIIKWLHKRSLTLEELDYE